MKANKLFIILVIIGVICFSHGIQSDAADLKPYKFGALLAMTGSGAWYGKTMSRGLTLAADEINDAGGVAGYKLVPIVEDHKSGNTTTGQNALRKLISIHKVSFIASSYGSITFSIGPVIKERHICTFNGGGASPRLVNLPYLHNTRMLADSHVTYLLKYLWGMGCRKIATIYYNQESGIAVSNVANNFWESIGGKVVDEEIYATGSTNLKSEVSRIKAAKPDCIGCWNYGTDIGYTLKDIRKMGLKVPIGGLEFSRDIQQIAGKAADGFLYMFDYFDVNTNDPWTKRFVVNFIKKFEEEPDKFAANYYEIVYILKELISRVISKGGDPHDGAQLEAAIWDNPKFDSIYGGKMELRKDGTVVKPRCLFKVIDGKSVIIKKVF